jgi:hypothetical protein
MAITIENRSYPISTSNVETYDGATLYISPLLPSGASLNDVLETLDSVLNGLSSSSTPSVSSDYVTFPGAISGGTISILVGDDLTTAMSGVVSSVATLETNITGYLLKSTYDANTVLKADTDNTPSALTVAASTVVGRKSSGSIAALTMAELTTELNLVYRDSTNLVVKPYTSTYHLATGASTNADKRVVTVLDDATFANNPHLDFLHSVFNASDHGFVFEGMASTRAVLKCNGNLHDSNVLASSYGAGTNLNAQSLVLSHQTGIANTLRYWRFLKDGSDSNKLKFNYFNGTSASSMATMTTAGSFSLSSGVGITQFIDEDSFASDLATACPTQQSVKAYVDAEILSLDSDLSSDISDIVALDVHTTDGTGKHSLVNVGTFTYTQLLTDGSLAFGGYIPDNALMVGCVVDVVNAFTDDDINTSVIGIGVQTVGVGVEDVKVAATIGTDYTVATLAGTGLDFDPNSPVKMTAQRKFTVNVVLAGAATTLTAGKLRVYAYYLQSD